MGPLKAGVAAVNITPPVGVPLTGFAGRKSGCVGVHDELYAKALVLDDGSTKVALVTTDLLGLDFDLVERIREDVQAHTGIPGSHLMLTSTHTHSGPATITLRGFGARDEANVDVTCRKIVGAVRMAKDRLVKAQVGVGREEVLIGINRREMTADRGMVLGHNPDGAVAPYVTLLRVETVQGQPLALFFSHAAHPVSQGGLLVSADYCGYATAFVERAKPGITALFAQGCCGDINCYPRDGSWETTERLGVTLGAAAVKGAELLPLTDEVDLAATTEVIRLPLMNPESVAWAEQNLATQQRLLAEAEADGSRNEYQLQFPRGQVEWAEDVLRLAREGDVARTQPFEIQVLRLNDTGFVAWPGEVFVDYQLYLDEHSPFALTFALAYSNGCIGYVPSAQDFPLGGYEVASAYRYYGTLMIAPESEGLIKETTVRLLKSLQGTE